MGVRVREKVRREKVRYASFKAGFDFKQDRYIGRLNDNDFPRLINNQLTSFMFFNYPDSWNMENIWRVFKNHGNLKDIYMVSKRLKSGQRFAFAKFGDVTNVNKLLASLESIKFDGFPIRVFRAHDRSGPNVIRNQCWGVSSRVRNDRSGDERRNEHWSNAFTDGRGFNEVAATPKSDLRYKLNFKKEDMRLKLDSRKPKDVRQKVVEEEKDIKLVAINKDKCISQVYMDCCIVAHLNNIDLVNQFETLCRAEGLYDFAIKYLGGLDILIQCSSEEMANNIMGLEGHAINKWCSSIEKLKINYWTTGGRYVWVDIKGVPVTCWNEIVFREIAGKWGRVVQLENCSITSKNQNLLSGHALIHVMELDHIHGTAKIIVDDLLLMNVSVIENHDRPIQLDVDPPPFDRNEDVQDTEKED
ncbi:uncharacterized protein [Rutidosis leptorrhynchoides]|uniref:uncharacterized protein n=1 Tax=Rutidosis leptorrhynchoides TaxID=125765 RepID=UPI003A9939ED